MVPLTIGIVSEAWASFVGGIAVTLTPWARRKATRLAMAEDAETVECPPVMHDDAVFRRRRPVRVAPPEMYSPWLDRDEQTS
jgi:hypothetical protein